MSVFKHDGVFAGYLAPGVRQEGLLLRAAVKKKHKTNFLLFIGGEKKHLKLAYWHKKCFYFTEHRRLLSDDKFTGIIKYAHLLSFSLFNLALLQPFLQCDNIHFNVLCWTCYGNVTRSDAVGLLSWDLQKIGQSNYLNTRQTCKCTSERSFLWSYAKRSKYTSCCSRCL